ncbi:hypothetical protein [Prevotella melaninogenica]|jgi:hypothetical protein|uniref:hypothetical protein n=1 Tax=Prevotella melaninogenica TaxID=28132 RepID=UPI001BAA5F1B|nr:hypothetical protein [Prevotella melaninogenica]QUB66083.1 hypothetical protein J5A57_03020 [Prevotella melaninogenica]DAJ99717.1 MAG TPA: hypothetical protein [Caudoviricetes sp.]DAQ31421.1 MAG TPA: hypothetical protein [Caudoviricetes sp.]DAS20767.1 MAG TPA: hypothetical protein [Caudoviricetes sp.]
MATKKIEQPNVELQEVLDDILNETPTEYTFRGKKRMLGWLHKGTTRKFTHIELKEKNEWKKRIKQCAVVQLNNVWKIRFFYWLLWRYYYYIIDLDVWEVLGVLNVAKKKIQSAAFQLTTILATAMTDAMMTMTKAEAEHIQAEQAGEERLA